LSHAGHTAGVKKTLTIRRGAAQRKALHSCATAAGKTESKVVCGLPAIQLRANGTLGERAGRHLGQLDFADATLVLLADELGTGDVVTLDERGFRTYRFRGSRRFNLVPGRE